MSADRAHRRQLGELLVEQGVLTDAQLQLALAEQEASGAPLGEILVQFGITRGATIGNALAEQHGGPLRTEYGFALGPADGIGMAPEQTVQLSSSGLPDSGPVDRERVPEEVREQDDAIASLSAALDQRTQELERVRIELAARDHHRAELATVRADLEELRIELAKARDQASPTQELENALEQHKTEVARAHQERAQHQELVDELKHELEQARIQLDEAATSDQVRAELRQVLQQQEAEFAAVKAELARAQEERARHDKLVDELKHELEQARIQLDEVANSNQARAELRRALQHQEAEFAAVKAELARAKEDRAQHETLVQQLRQELSETANSDQARDDLRQVLQQYKVEFEVVKAELARAQQERAQNDKLVDDLKHELERARLQLDEAANHDRARAELRRALQHQEVEFAAVKAQLARAQQERAQDDKLVRELQQELERARVQLDEAGNGDQARDELRHVLQQQEAEFAAVKAELARAQEELTRHAVDTGAAPGFALSKTGQQAEQTQANWEPAPWGGHAKELERGVELAGIEIDEDVAPAGQQSLRDLELTLKEHRAELEAITAQLSRPLDERTEHVNRAHDLAEQLDRAITKNDKTAGERAERELVTVARTRAQRRYGPPLRTAGALEASHGDDGHRRPPATKAHADTANLGEPTAFMIPLWQLALLIVVVPIALYVLIPVNGLLAAAVVMLFGAVTLFHTRIARWARKGSSSQKAQQSISEPPARS